MTRLRIGVSKCLLGEAVRWDGGHKRDHFLNETLAPFVTWVPLCPEVESGLPVPRDTMRLEASPEGGTVVNGHLVRLIITKTGGDWTDEMAAWSAKKATAIAREGLDGFVLKKDSPSCGLERVRIYGGTGPASKTGRGVFAEALVQACPDLPVEDEGRLNDPALRENFIERVFAYRTLRDLFDGRWTVGALVRFHTAHKLTLLAHKPTAYQALGRLVARAKGMGRAELHQQYVHGFMEGMKAIATPGRHANVLEHMAGYLRDHLDEPSRTELRETIEDHRRGHVPLVVPLTLVKHHARRHGVAYLLGQTYLDPHPKELALRNHV
jgi:uncharacterized protein YbgA (DUF1722 family)/uncharacterized protein YbbK (DUF523 family)